MWLTRANFSDRTLNDAAMASDKLSCNLKMFEVEPDVPQIFLLTINT